MFFCEICNYKTKYKHNYQKHLTTNKHWENFEKKKNPSHFVPFRPVSSHSVPFSTKLEKNVKKPENLRHFCRYCNRDYKQKQHLNRHLKKCKNKVKKLENKNDEKKFNEEDFYEEFKKMQNENDKIKKECKKLEKKLEKQNDGNSLLMDHITKLASMNNGNKIDNSNSSNCNTVSIIVNDYGNENMSFIEKPKYKKLIGNLLKDGFSGLQKYIKIKYCNPKISENLTVKYTNKRQNDIQILNQEKWITRPTNEVMDEIYDKDKNVEELLHIYDKMNGTEDLDELDTNQIKFLENIIPYYDEKKNEKSREMNNAKKMTLNDIYNCYKNNKNVYK